MASTLNAYSNGALTFKLPTSGTITDPYTGNVTANTSSAVHRVFVAEAGSSTQVNFAGVDVRTSRFEGYATDPELLSDDVTEGMTGTLQIDDGATYEVTLLGARSAYGRKGIGAILESSLGHSLVMDAVKQE